MRTDIVPGAIFPDYELPDHRGKHRTLSELQRDEPLVLVPHTLVLEPGLRVYKIYNGYWFFGRPTVEELRLDLRAVLSRCRPDWDISSTELRSAWANGEKAKFFPYGKTQAQLLEEED
jgi:hypothetical protein